MRPVAHVARECRCGKTFFVKPSAALRGRGQFCSRDCRYQAQNAAGNPNWQGGAGKDFGRFFAQKKVGRDGRRAVYAVVHEAIRTGRLVPQNCEGCGTSDRVQAHHDDYSKPLEVKWLCPVHHRRRHDELRGEATLARVLAERARAGACP